MEARIIPWSGRARQVRESPVTVSTTSEAAGALAPGLAALDGVLLVLPDEQLEALGTIFASSPLRRAMTFEGYLVVKGLGRPLG